MHPAVNFNLALKFLFDIQLPWKYTQGNWIAVQFLYDAYVSVN